MLRAIRAKVNAALVGVPAGRKPALRRSDIPGALLATDLPLAADDGSVRSFTAAMEAQDIRVLPGERGWLLLDAPVPVPLDCGEPLPQMPPECACCLSLLERHAEDNGEAEELIREVVRAEEAGRQPFERMCARLHERLAERLRLHQALPGVLLPYLKHALRALYSGRNA